MDKDDECNLLSCYRATDVLDKATLLGVFIGDNGGTG